MNRLCFVLGLLSVVLYCGCVSQSDYDVLVADFRAMNDRVSKMESDLYKVEIKKAIEEIFEVKVVAIRTVNVHRKPKRMSRYEGFKPAYKKAIVRLEPGQTIKEFEV